MPNTTFTVAEDKYILTNRDTMSWADLAAALGGGRDREQVRKRHWRLTSAKGNPNEPKTPQANLDRVYDTEQAAEGVEKTETDSGCVIRSVDPVIRTVEDLIRVCNIDLDKWHIVRSECGAWGGFAKTGSRKVSPGHHVKDLTKVTLFKVRVKLEPKKGSVDLNSFKEQLLAAVRREAVSLPPCKRVRALSASRPCMYEISILDHHFGKLAWAAETGDNYDLKIAIKRFKDALVDLLGRVRTQHVEKILMPVGHDLFHVDSMLNTTTAGTPQDVDGRWQKSFMAVYETMVWAIRECREVAPVDVVMVPGNHDFQRTFYLGEVLKARFFDATDVTIDNSPVTRKYVRYGRTLIGLTHGSDEKPKDLPTIMANEVPGEWAASTFRIWHLGHLHKQSEETIGGVNLRRCPSLCGTDAWHNRMGYVGTPKMAEAFRYDRDLGLQATEVYTPID